MDKEFINNPVEAYENLKRENERLKRENEIITGMCNSASKRFDKLYNTLQEIKKIALLGTNTYKEEKEPNSLSTWKNAQFEKIITLITKAENEV